MKIALAATWSILCLALVRPGPAITLWASARLEGVYDLLAWSTCAAVVIVACWFLLAKYNPATIPRLLAVLSLSGIVVSMGVCTNEIFHLFLYLILGFLWSLASGIQGAFIGAFFGLTDEIIQGILPGRYFEFRDVLMNVTAVCAGVISGLPEIAKKD